MMVAINLHREIGEPSGLVAEGVQFDDGTIILHWLTEPKSEERYASYGDFEKARLSSGNCKAEMWRISR